MEVHSFPDHLLVVLRGELDGRTSGRFRTELAQLMEKQDADIHLDLAEVRYADSGAVNLLLTLHRGLDAKGRRLVLHRVSPAVERVLKLAHLDMVFRMPSP